MKHSCQLCLTQGRQRRKRERPLQLSLYVRWYSPSGKTKVNRLLLRPVTCVEALEVGFPPNNIRPSDQVHVYIPESGFSPLT